MNIAEGSDDGINGGCFSERPHLLFILKHLERQTVKALVIYTRSVKLWMDKQLSWQHTQFGRSNIFYEINLQYPELFALFKAPLFCSLRSDSTTTAYEMSLEGLRC